MKIVKLDETLENLDRVKDVQPVIDIITADAQQTANKISSKTVLEKVRDILGEEAFLGAVKQPTPKKVKVPEALSLDESLFVEADGNRLEDEYYYVDKDFNLFKTTPEGKILEGLNETQDLEEAQDFDEYYYINKDFVLFKTTPEGKILGAVGNMGFGESLNEADEEKTGHRATSHGTAKIRMENDPFKQLWIMLVAHKLCNVGDPVKFRYLPYKGLMTPIIETVMENCIVNNTLKTTDRWGGLDRGHVLYFGGRASASGDGEKRPSSSFAAGPKLITYIKEHFPMGIDLTTEFCETTLDKDGMVIETPGTRWSIGKFYELVDEKVAEFIAHTPKEFTGEFKYASALLSPDEYKSKKDSEEDEVPGEPIDDGSEEFTFDDDDIEDDGSEEYTFDDDDVETESLEETVDAITQKRRKCRKEAYRKFAGLDEDCELTEDNIDDWCVSHLSALNGWFYDQALEDLLSRE